MPDGEPGSVTAALAATRKGDPDARARLFDYVYSRLRRLAAAQTAGERDAAAQPTSVLHAALVRILESPSLLATAPDRAYFFAAVTRAIRRVLVDRARERTALKRGGGRRTLPLDALIGALADERTDAVVIEDALSTLERIHARACQVITLRAFGGFTAAEVAEQLAVSVSTVEKDIRFARAWLHRALRDDDGDA